MTKLTANQAAFNGAWRGLKWQGFEQSLLDGQCAFRGDSGRRCAIGWLIPDDRYRSAWDSDPHGMAAGRMAALARVTSVAGTLPDDHLLTNLRDAHDFAKFPADMESRLRQVAAKWDLTIPGDE